MAYRVLAIGYCQEEHEKIRLILKSLEAELNFAESVQDAQYSLKNRHYDCAVFHPQMLDCLSYIDVLRSIQFIPVIILTPDYPEIKGVQKAGKFADFLIGENASGERREQIFRYRELCLDQGQRTVFVQGKEVKLTTREFELLALLVSNPMRIFTYELLAEIVWNEDYDIYTRKTITNHVSSLRRKLQITPEIPNYIKSIHNIGYRFNGKSD